ncbi:MAG: hypothetical protein UHO61_01695 [Acutalibacteraceae bacterium]|nr:hypothetical protein [Acutalibacteraceae bacterium]
MRKLCILFLVIAMLSGTLCACTNNTASEDGKTSEDMSNMKISTNSTQELTSDTLTDSTVKEENTSNAASTASNTTSSTTSSTTSNGTSSENNSTQESNTVLIVL